MAYIFNILCVSSEFTGIQPYIETYKNFIIEETARTGGF